MNRRAKTVFDPLIVHARLAEGAELPEPQTAGSAGWDIRANERKIIPPGGISAVGTGVFLDIPAGYEAQVRPRSGLALKHGISILNSPGTIDSDYRGELQVIIINHSTVDFQITPGDRIAQLVFAPVTSVRLRLAKRLSRTRRGAGGFGHTGR